LQRLEDAGAFKTLPSGKVRSRPSSDVKKAVQAAAQADEKRREFRRQALEKMREYAETSGCRRELLLRYLGDEFNGPCNRCDNCDAAAGSAAPTTAAMP